MFAPKSLLLGVVEVKQEHIPPSSFPATRTNLHFTGHCQVTPLLDDMLQVDTGQGQSDLTNDVMLGKAIEVVDLHHQCGFRHLSLGYLQGRTQKPGLTPQRQLRPLSHFPVLIPQASPCLEGFLPREQCLCNTLDGTKKASLAFVCTWKVKLSLKMGFRVLR